MFNYNWFSKHKFTMFQKNYIQIVFYNIQSGLVNCCNKRRFLYYLVCGQRQNMTGGNILFKNVWIFVYFVFVVVEHTLIYFTI